PEQGRGHGTELPVARALPTASDHCRPDEAKRLHMLYDHDTAEQCRSRELLGGVTVALSRLRYRLLLPTGIAARLFVQPGFQALPLHVVLLIKRRFRQRYGESVGTVCGVVQIGK